MISITIFVTQRTPIDLFPSLAQMPYAPARSEWYWFELELEILTHRELASKKRCYTISPCLERLIARRKTLPLLISIIYCLSHSLNSEMIINNMIFISRSAFVFDLIGNIMSRTKMCNSAIRGGEIFS